jgi:hypothetical protein
MIHKFKVRSDSMVLCFLKPYLAASILAESGREVRTIQGFDTAVKEEKPDRPRALSWAKRERT